MWLRYHTYTIVWAIFILFLSLTPTPALAHFDILSLFQLDKLVHLIMYGILSLLYLVGAVKTYGYPTINIYLRYRAIGVCGALGFAIEVLQTLAVSRSFDFFDIVANIIGAVSGIYLFKIIYAY